MCVCECVYVCVCVSVCMCVCVMCVCLCVNIPIDRWRTHRTTCDIGLAEIDFNDLSLNTPVMHAMIPNRWAGPIASYRIIVRVAVEATVLAMELAARTLTMACRWRCKGM